MFNTFFVDEMLIFRLKYKKNIKKVVYSKIYKYVYDLEFNNEQFNLELL
jgi:hypothetical protein